MIKSIAAVVALIAQLAQWLKVLADKKAVRDRERRNEEIEQDPAGEFIDKFSGESGWVRHSGDEVLRDEAGVTADQNAAKRDSSE